MQKLRIGILMGGKSLEKEVSFNSGRTICDHLDTTRYTAVPLFQTNAHIYLLPWHFLHRGKTTDFEHRLATEAQQIAWDDIKNYIDFMYIAQHGRYAEDGCLQGFLELLRIPYLGSGILPSALRADKHIHKIILRNAGIAVPRHITVEPYEIDNFEQCKNSILARLDELNISDNYIIKPYNEGSSLGISVAQKNTLEHALKKACYLQTGTKKRVIIEEKISGMEFTCIVLTDPATGDFFALPPTESVANPEIGFFDYEQKYMPGRGIKRTPAQCSTEITQRIQSTCIHVMQVLEFTTMGRIDGFVAHDGTIVIIDPNTFSGMAPSSYIFNQAAEINMTPSNIISFLIESEIKRYNIPTFADNHHKTDKSVMDKQKIRVAVLLGGASNEKETSLDSGRNVFYKLSPQKYMALPIFVNNSLELFTLTQAQLVRNSTKEIEELLHDSQKIKWSDLPTIADFVFNALHGGEGENGSVQGTLEMLGLPYNGSSVLASALCMNKYKTNQFLAMNGFDVPKSVFVTRKEWIISKEALFSKFKPSCARPDASTSSLLRQGFVEHAAVNTSPDLSCARPELVEGYLRALEDTLQQVQGERGKEHKNISLLLTTLRSLGEVGLIVKPHNDGCSVMVQKVSNETELIASIDAIMQKKDAALIEEYITGMELTVGVIGNDNPRALPPSQAMSAQGILSIEEKFLPGAGENQTPAPLTQEALRFVQETIERVYKTVQCSGYARIDCFYQTAEQSPTNTQRVIILEINTLPGLTPATCLFHQAAEIGLKPMEFIDTIIMLGFEEHKPQELLLQNATRADGLENEYSKNYIDDPQ